MTVTRWTSNAQMRQALDDLSARLDSFVEQYNQDMRGTSDPSCRQIGIVAEIRELRAHLTVYPSLTWLLSHRTVLTVTTILLTYAVLWILFTVGAVEVSGLGLTIHAPPTPTIAP